MPRVENETSAVAALLAETLDRLLTTADAAGQFEALAGRVPPAVAADLRATAENKSRSYPEAAAIQLARQLLAGGGVDLLAGSFENHRGMGTAFADALRARHVNDGTKGAFHSGVLKSATTYDVPKQPAFTALLRWATGAEAAEVRTAFEALMAAFAARSRPVLPMPTLWVERLTFAAVCGLFARLLREPSRGVFEQMAVGALVHALVRQYGGASYVQTKHVHANDRASGAACDVQVMSGQRGSGGRRGDCRRLGREVRRRRRQSRPPRPDAPARRLNADSRPLRRRTVAAPFGAAGGLVGPVAGKGRSPPLRPCCRSRAARPRSFACTPSCRKPSRTWGGRTST